MREVKAGLFQSVDGVVESPNLWQFDSFDEELGAGMGRMMTETDTVLLGRTSYQEWADYWPGPGAGDPFAAFINPVEKFVASRTLHGELAWQNSTLVGGDLEAFVADLRQSDGGDISVCGSISVVRQLLFAGLIDGLTLMIHPVVAGSGRKLFQAGDPRTRLVLLDSQTTSKGNLVVTYGRHSG